MLGHCPELMAGRLYLVCVSRDWRGSPGEFRRWDFRRLSPLDAIESEQEVRNGICKTYGKKETLFANLQVAGLIF